MSDLWKARGRRYEHCTLDNFEVTTPAQQTVLAAVRGYLDDLEGMVGNGDGLFLYGPPGTGKDHLLAAVMRAAVSHGIEVVWRSGPEMFAELRDRLDDDRTTESNWIAGLRSPKVLAISDPMPPVGGLSKYQAAMFYAVVDARYNMRRPTWVTCNVTGSEDADAQLTPPIFDRLRDKTLALCCDWESYRKPRACDIQG